MVFYANIFPGGGSTEAVKFLIDKGAYVNSRGHFRRTPLYRAAFAGHLETAEVSNRHSLSSRGHFICSLDAASERG